MATFYFRRSDQDFDLNVATLVEACRNGAAIEFTLIGPSREGKSAYRVYEHVTDIRLENSPDGYRLAFYSKDDNAKGLQISSLLRGIDTIVAKIEL